MGNEKTLDEILAWMELEGKIEEAQLAAEEAQSGVEDAIYEAQHAEMLANKSLDIIETLSIELNELRDEIYELKEIIEKLK